VLQLQLETGSPTDGRLPCRVTVAWLRILTLLYFASH